MRESAILSERGKQQDYTDSTKARNLPPISGISIILLVDLLHFVDFHSLNPLQVN